MTFPADIPSRFDELLSLSDRLGGEAMIFGPDDEIVHVTSTIRARYPFFDFSPSSSYSDLYWAVLEHGMSTRSTLRLEPETYLAMAIASRRANDTLDFQKRYSGAHLLCHHRRLPDGWNAQVRVDLDRLRSRAPVDAPLPLTLFDALASTHEANCLSAVLDRLPIGIAFIDRTGRPRWCNAAARHAFSAGTAMNLTGGHLHFTDAEARTAFADGLTAAIDKERTSYLALADGGRTVLLSITPGTSADEAMLLMPPATPTEAIIEDALGMLGLSPAERRVAISIVAEGGPAGVAAATGKAPATVRRQLATIYGKLGLNMGVTSQRALAHLIGQVASIAGAPRARTYRT